MKSNLRKKIRRQRLWVKQKGKCWYCGCDTIHWNDIIYKPKNHKKYKVYRDEFGLKIAKPPGNMATLEHLVDKFDGRRKESNYRKKRWVVACMCCNHTRGRNRDMSRRAA